MRNYFALLEFCKITRKLAKLGRETRPLHYIFVLHSNLRIEREDIESDPAELVPNILNP